jgi:hypothetical protein
MAAIREALGAIPVAPPLAYSLRRARGTHWRLRRLDERDAADFETRAAALAAMRQAVVRCSAYCLLVEGCDIGLDIQFLNWDDRAAMKFGVRP